MQLRMKSTAPFCRFCYISRMKRILKLNPQYPISIGLILMGIGGVFFDSTSDIGLVVTLLGGFIIIAGATKGFYQTKKR